MTTSVTVVHAFNVLLLIFGSSLTLAVDADDFAWCILPPMLHLRYFDNCTTFSNYSSKQIQLQGMRGEFENSQFLVQYKGAAAANISISGSDLVLSGHGHSNSNTRIPSSMLTFYQVGHVFCQETTRYAGSGGGWRPDPMFELAADSYGTAVALATNYTQTLWINVQIPYGSAQGVYGGQITVAITNAVTNQVISSFNISLSVQVWDITVPTTFESAFQTVFSFDESALNQFYKAPQYNTTAMRQQYWDYLTQNRLPPDDLYQSSTRPFADYAYLATRTQWANLEDVAKQLSPDGSQCMDFTQAQIESMLNSLKPVVAQLQAAGLDLHHTYVYGFDEVASSCEPGLQQVFGAVQQQWPGIKTMSAIDWSKMPPLALALDAFVIQYQLYNAADAAAWVNNTAGFAGKEYWLYHCIEPSGLEYLNTFIERPLMEARLLFWLGALYNTQGWLYYAVDLWRGCPAQGIPDKHLIHRLQGGSPFTDFDPANYIWCPRTDIFANGDGYFLYPGAYGPVTTQRMENIRDGLEDLELLRMVTDVQTRAHFIQQLVWGATQYNLNPALLQSVRAQVAQQVLKQQNVHL